MLKGGDFKTVGEAVQQQTSSIMSICYELLIHGGFVLFVFVLAELSIFKISNVFTF